MDNEFDHMMISKDKVTLNYHGIIYTYKNIGEAAKAIEALNWQEDQKELAEIADVNYIYSLFMFGTWAFNLPERHRVVFIPKTAITSHDEKEFAKFLNDHKPSQHAFNDFRMECLANSIGSSELTITPKLIIAGTVAAMCQNEKAVFTLKDGKLTCILENGKADPLLDGLLGDVLEKVSIRHRLDREIEIQEEE